MKDLPAADWLLGDRGYDADWFREALVSMGITPCIPGRKSRGKTIKYDKRRYKKRNRIEIMFGHLKDWRRVATRYDRRPKVFCSAIAHAATVISGYEMLLRGLRRTPPLRLVRPAQHCRYCRVETAWGITE